jgi:hypothetical protein
MNKHIATFGFAAMTLIGAVTAGATEFARGTIISCDPTQIFALNAVPTPTINGRGKFTKATNVLIAESILGTSTTARLVNTAGTPIVGCSVTDAVGGSTSSITCGAITGAVNLEVLAN